MADVLFSDPILADLDNTQILGLAQINSIVIVDGSNVQNEVCAACSGGQSGISSSSVPVAGTMIMLLAGIAIAAAIRGFKIGLR